MVLSHRKHMGKGIWNNVYLAGDFSSKRNREEKDAKNSQDKSEECYGE